MSEFVYDSEEHDPPARWLAKPGSKLKNGCTVLLLAGPGAGDYFVVLAQKENGDYATWRVSETGDAFWGDYFQRANLEAACESFMQRAFALSTSRYDAQRDAEFIEQTLGDEVSNALAAIICDADIRDYLQRQNPELLRQAREALILP